MLCISVTTHLLVPQVDYYYNPCIPDIRVHGFLLDKPVLTCYYSNCINTLYKGEHNGKYQLEKTFL